MSNSSVKQTLLDFTQRVRDVFSVPVNGMGGILVGSGVGFSVQPLLRDVTIVENQIDLDIARGSNESFKRVFDTWTRISRLVGREGDAATPSELNSWSYIPATDAISCTINSASVVGFISPDRYDDFVLEVVLRSTNSDDDFIGVAIAFVEDVAGKTHMLSVMRGGNGKAPMSIDINYNGFDKSEINLDLIRDGLTWFNDTVAVAGGANGGNGGWNIVPSGILLKVTRVKDNITIETGQPNAGEYFTPATRTFNLNDHPELAKFKGPQRYGYIAQSQASSTWTTLSRPGGKEAIYDSATGQLWSHDTGSWSTESRSIGELVDSGLLRENWLHHNPATNRFYYVADNALRRL